MRKKIKKFSRRLTNRENITALGLLVAVAGVVAMLAGVVFVSAEYNGMKTAKDSKHNAYEDEIRELSGITTNLEPVPDLTTNWKTFSSEKYKVSIKYPSDWTAGEQTTDPVGKYLDKISFTNNRAFSQYQGFEIFVYDSSKYKDPAATDNLVKKDPAANTSDCSSFDDITLGEEQYPAKEINIAASNPCYKETFFYSLTKGQFTYNLIPHFGNSFNIAGYNDKISLIKVFPRFYDIVSTINISSDESIVGTSRKFFAAAAKPRVMFTAGARCSHKNDHPSYSNKGKGKHMDEDCCPDPDEWPNPRCAYSGSQLGVMKATPKK